MEKDLKILIVGSAGSGKTTLAELVSMSLKAHNLNPIIINTDGPTNLETFEKRIESLRLPELTIPIEEVQTQRPGMNRQRRCHDCPKTRRGTKIR